MFENAHRINIAAIFRLNNVLIKQKNKKLRTYDLTSIQADVLYYILLQPSDNEINQLDIQNVFKLTNPTVSGIIDRLEEKGFLKREKSEKDARFRKLVPLPKGTALLDVLISSARSAEEALLANMTDAEKAEFERLLFIVLKTAEDS